MGISRQRMLEKELADLRLLLAKTMISDYRHKKKKSSDLHLASGSRCGSPCRRNRQDECSCSGRHRRHHR